VSSNAKSGSDSLGDRVDSLRLALRYLLLDKSGLKWVNTRSDRVVTVGFGDHMWLPLDEEGWRVRADLLDEIEEMVALLRAEAQPLASDAARRITCAERDLKEVVEQRCSTYIQTTEQALQRGDAALRDLLALRSSLHRMEMPRAAAAPDPSQANVKRRLAQPPHR
jgi:hypothetical protein